MIKKFNLGLLAVAILATFGVANYASATSALTWTANYTVDLTNDLMILSGAGATSLIVGTDNFQVEADGSVFKVGSADSAVKTIVVTQGGSPVACALNTTPDGTTSYVTVPTTVATYTVAPSTLTSCQDQCSAVSNAATLNTFNGSPTCGAATCNSGYDLSGSGGSATCSLHVSSGSGGGYINRATPAIPAVPGISPAIPATPSIQALTHASPRAAFNRRLALGNVNNDVKNLQQFLNSRGFTVAISGAGSLGNETLTFGPATKKALIKFQIAQGIVQTSTDDGAGELGPKTRGVINNTATAPVLTSDRQALLDSLRSQLNQLLEQLRQLQAQRAAGQ